MKTLNKYCPCLCFDKFDNKVKDIIKVYDFWILYLNFKQDFPGRSMAILREHKNDITEISEKENSELLKIIKEWKFAINKISIPYNINIFISNTEVLVHNGHLHIHLIPRYDKSIRINGVTFPHDKENEKSIFYNKLNRNSTASKRTRKLIICRLNKYIK